MFPIYPTVVFEVLFSIMFCYLATNYFKNLSRLNCKLKCFYWQDLNCSPSLVLHFLWYCAEVTAFPVSFLLLCPGSRSLGTGSLYPYRSWCWGPPGWSQLCSIPQVLVLLEQSELCSSGPLLPPITTRFMSYFNICSNHWNHFCGSWHRRGDCWIDILSGIDENLFIIP